MTVIDIMFPLNVPILRYKSPVELESRLRTGMMVWAPLRGRVRKGIVASIKDRHEKEELLEIAGIAEEAPILTDEHLKLIEWIEDYYHSNSGLLLKSMLPKEFFKENEIKSKRKSSSAADTAPFTPVDISAQDTGYIKQAASKGRGFEAILHHSPSFDYEISLLIEILKSIDRAIILCPEINEAEYVASILMDFLERETFLIHSGIGGMKRASIYKDIIGMNLSIVLGTLSSVLIPMKRPSLIVVLQEQSRHYKQEKSPCFNARDVAVKRASIEKIPVLLTSICPSSASYFNAIQGKYRLMEPEYRKRRFYITVSDTGRGKPVSPGVIIDPVKKASEKSSKSLIIAGRKGYSLLRCHSCGYIEECANCSHPLVFHKDKSLRCRVCGTIKTPGDTCKKCSGITMNVFGAGTQRIEEMLSRFDMTPLRIDSDLIKGRKAFKKTIKSIRKSTVVVATSLINKNFIFSRSFDHIIITGPDISFILPDYLSMERLFQETASVSEKLKDGGRLTIRTSFVTNEVFKFIKARDYKGFIRNEINKRKELGYPPYTNLASLIFHLKENELLPELLDISTDVTITGPVPSESRRKGYDYSMRVILKAKERNAINECIREVHKRCTGKNIRVITDIDPVSFY